MGASYREGKTEVARWIKERFDDSAKILDVGCGEGLWADYLAPYRMDAIEIFKPYIEEHRIKDRYRTVMICDVEDVLYDDYDLVIFGDVIEHMSVDKAKRVLEYASAHSNTHIVAVPWLYEQGPVNGNEHERHIQPDLTKAIFDERYPGYSVIWEDHRYAYMYKTTTPCR